MRKLESASDITSAGNIISASIADSKLSENILRVGEKILNQAGGTMEKEELFCRIRENTIQPLSDATLSASLLHKKTNLKWIIGKGEKTIISFKK